MIDDRAPDEASLTWTLMTRTLFVVEGDPVSNHPQGVGLAFEAMPMHALLLKVRITRSIKSSNPYGADNRGHLVTDDELLEAFDAFANYRKN